MPGQPGLIPKLKAVDAATQPRQAQGMFRQRPDADLIVQGWVVGVMVEVAGERLPVRHYFGVGKAERAQAEWAAVDKALEVGAVASSPFRGTEPVEAIREIVAYRMRDLGLKPGEIRALGDKFPRRWLPVQTE